MRRSLKLALACTWALLAGGQPEARALYANSLVLAAAAAPLASQSSTVSGVTATVKPLVITGDRLEFEIVLETHTGDLGDDLLENAVLLTENGERLRPVQWRGDPAGGHHRKGVLVFQAVKAAPAAVELRIARPGEPGPRIFRWQLS